MEGQVTDIDIRLREQRRQPLLFTLACAGVGGLVLMLAMAPTALTTLAAALWVEGMMIFVVTLRGKIRRSSLSICLDRGV